jgi:nitric oxide reductase activation protein
VVADGRRRSRVRWSIRRTQERFPLAMAVGGPDGEAPRLVPVDEAPEDGAESSDHDRRIGVPYPEWDYRTERYRDNFVTVIERRIAPRAASVSRIDPSLRRWFAAPHQTCRVGRLEDGDQIDVASYVDAYCRTRAGEDPDYRVYEGPVSRRRDVATAVLLDATSSLQSRGGAGFHLQLACVEALCSAMSSTGERFAVFAFTGETRHRVDVIRLRDFADPSSMLPVGSMVRPSGYTRLGAALRHVTARLKAAPAERRVLLSIGDAAPSDEGYEGVYAEADVRRATDEALAAGVIIHQIAVGRSHPDRLERCFGAGRFHHVTRADDLPAVLARMHEELTRT